MQFLAHESRLAERGKMMRISLTTDLWKQIQSAQKAQIKKSKTRESSGKRKQPDLLVMPNELKLFSDEWIHEPGTWFARFVKIDRRRYLLLLQTSTGLAFHVAGIKDKDLVAPTQLFDHWIRQGLLACGLTAAAVDDWMQQQGDFVFYNGGSRSLVAKINQAVRDSGFHLMDLVRPVKRELALNSLYDCLYSGYHNLDRQFGRVMIDFCKVFFPGQSIQFDEKPIRFGQISCVEFADHTPALLVPGVEVIVELCRFGSKFGYPIGSQAEARKLPLVRRVLHVPVDSNLFQ